MIFFCEVLISPVLSEVLKSHSKLNLWSHDYFIETSDNDLTRIPDYIISYKGDIEDYEQLIFPLLTITDAKKDDFAGGWAQTLAEIISCQKLNKENNLNIFGIVTNGTVWEFGILKSDTFIKDDFSYSISFNLNKIAGIIDYIYTQTTKQVEKYLIDNNIPIRKATNI